MGMVHGTVPVRSVIRVYWQTLGARVDKRTGYVDHKRAEPYGRTNREVGSGADGNLRRNRGSSGDCDDRHSDDARDDGHHDGDEYYGDNRSDREREAWGERPLRGACYHPS